MISFLANYQEIPPLIIIAGGKSKRMGSPKGLLEIYHNYCLLEYQLDKYRLAGGKFAVVVLGYDSRKYIQKLAFLDELPCKVSFGSLSVLFVENKLPEYGPFSTRQTGIKALFENFGETGFFFSNIDNIMPSYKHLRGLVEEQKKVAISLRKNKNTNPVFIKKDIAKRILKLDYKSSRLDEFIKTIDKKDIGYKNLEDELSGININHYETWQKVKPKISKPPFIYAILGEQYEGKTSAAQKLSIKLREKGLKVGGITQPKTYKNNKLSGYLIEDITTKETYDFAKITNEETSHGLRFDFDEQTQKKANDIIIKARQNCDILIIDEIGKIEAKGQGHMKALKQHMKKQSALVYFLFVRGLVFKDIEKQFDIKTIKSDELLDLL